MDFLKKTKNEINEVNLLKNGTNTCGFFYRTNGKTPPKTFEKNLKNKEKIQEFGGKIIWEVESKILFIGEGEIPFNFAFLLKFSNSNDLFKFTQSNFFKNIKEDFNKNKYDFEVLFLKERILPLPLKFVVSIFKNIGKIVPFSRFKSKEKSDFENLGGINPSLNQLEALENSNLGGPLHMINFLSFRGKEGFSYYQKYGFVALRGVLFLGGKLVFIGRITDDTHENWDQLAIMEYPSIESFKNLVYMPGYSKATAFRAKGLLKTLLIISMPLKK